MANDINGNGEKTDSIITLEPGKPTCETISKDRNSGKVDEAWF